MRLPKGSGNDLEININPGLRDRIIAEMDGAKILEEARLRYLCMMTGRAPQTARRWLAEDKPGLPDLMSFALLCARFDADANWMLGLTQTRYALPKGLSGESGPQGTGPEWVKRIIRQVEEDAAACETMTMPGDDMEPRIKDGAPILVDTGAAEIKGNGTYLLEYKGRTLVRHVEIRIGEGMLLSCENAKYKSTVVKDVSAAKKLGLKVLGRVRLAIGIEKL